MEIKIHIILVTLSCYVFAYHDFTCKKKTVLLLIRRPAFEFSIRLLQRVAEDTNAHFVLSPLTTWLQMIALSDGARGETFDEILKLTRQKHSKCFKRKFHQVIPRLQRGLRYKTKRQSVMVIDKGVLPKTQFILEMQEVYGIDVMVLDFNKPTASSFQVNRLVDDVTGGIIDGVVYEDDFIDTVLLMSDANFFHSVWQTEFFRGYTQTRTFFSSHGAAIGTVNMMYQTGYFCMVEIPQIGVKVLELPLGNPGISMLFFLPTTKAWVGELFYNLEKLDLITIFNFFKIEEQRLVNVAIPKFIQVTEVENLSELLYDMGIKRIFDRELSELEGVGEYNVHASVMTQVTHIRVNEKGLSFGVDFDSANESSVEFIADRPFAYMVVDKTINFIIYAGAYSVPSLV
ncbi:unnamed protein product [Arctia plantaginis]|uniref:Serpin domain-containing protein n=1 Tax=Arctia plantaginis TaxID=874455 RepID=A0A8S0Z328_ARCPL|nr:unnamed protein product [Arctia plantaginis]